MQEWNIVSLSVLLTCTWIAKNIIIPKNELKEYLIILLIVVVSYFDFSMWVQPFFFPLCTNSWFKYQMQFGNKGKNKCEVFPFFEPHCKLMHYDHMVVVMYNDLMYRLGVIRSEILKAWSWALFLQHGAPCCEGKERKFLTVPTLPSHDYSIAMQEFQM